jgi:hypothetical protein
MSLRYVHLAPDQRREAVARLNQKPLLALTIVAMSVKVPVEPMPYIETSFEPEFVTWANLPDGWMDPA